jgi:hypothetical protein
LNFYQKEPRGWIIAHRVHRRRAVL